MSTPTPKEIAERFARITAHLPKGEIEPLVRALAERDVAAGSALLVEGDPSSTLYLLWGGELAVTIRADASSEEVGRLRPGAVVGEISLIDGGRATATVTAAADSRVFALSRDALLILEREHPRVAAAIYRAMCDALSGRIRSATTRYEATGENLESGAPTAGRGWLDSLRDLFGIARG
jgi:SulP family sulfate permease